jgi:hypothetical protein
MKFQFDIESVMVIKNSGADVILFNVNNIASGCWPYEGCQSFKVEVAKGLSETWLIENFGNEILNITKIAKTS